MQTPTALSAGSALFALFVMADSSFARKLHVPDCGTIVGRVEGSHSGTGHAVAGLRVTVGNGQSAVTDTTNRHGAFELQVPGPGALTLVAERTGADSASVAELSPQRAYTMALDVRDTDAGQVEIAAVTLTPRRCAGPTP